MSASNSTMDAKTRDALISEIRVLTRNGIRRKPAYHISNALPAWVHEEYADCTRQAESKLMVDVLNAPDLLWVWESIGRAEYPNARSTYMPFARLQLIESAIRNGLRPLDWRDKLTGTERKRKAERIAALADELAGESDFFVGVMGDDKDEESGTHARVWPDGPANSHSFYDFFSVDTMASFVRLWLSNGWSEDSEFYQSLDDDRKEDLRSILRHAFLFAMSRSPEMLGTIAGAMKAWGHAEQKLYRPEGPNAQRQLFIKSVTAMFVQEFGRPFREETLALTGHYFDIEGLDAAALSRLAPVPK